MYPCPVCREPLPDEHWRVLAEHATCQKPALLPPPEPEADRSAETAQASRISKGLDRLRSAVGEAIATISTSGDVSA